MFNLFKVQYIVLFSLVICVNCKNGDYQNFTRIELLLHCDYEPYRNAEVSIFKYKWYKNDEAIVFGITNYYGVVTFDIQKKLIKNSQLYVWINDKCKTETRKKLIYKRKMFIDPSYFTNIFSIKKNPIKDSLFGVIPLSEEPILGPFGYHILSMKVKNS